jgi:hypothetical protein
MCKIIVDKIGDQLIETAEWTWRSTPFSDGRETPGTGESASSPSHAVYEELPHIL